MSRLAGVAAGLLLITMADPLCAAATYPPVEQATFHQLMFANDDVAVLKNVRHIVILVIMLTRANFSMS